MFAPADRRTAAPSTPVPYRFDVPEAELADLRRRLDSARFAADFGNDEWRYGMNGERLRELVDYWRNGYDWRRWEAYLNGFDNYLVDIDGIAVHFLHQRGLGERPMPLLLTHGWPWTFHDYTASVGPLTDPASAGHDPSRSFDVVVPSLPGFGPSGPLTRTGVNAYTTAGLWVRLMRDVLGYDRFAASGGDWGALITAYLGHAHADLLHGIHLTTSTWRLLFHEWPDGAARDGGIRAEDVGPGEEGFAASNAARAESIRSHKAVNISDPQTLAFALDDSPIGLLAWLTERRYDWSGVEDLDSAFSRDFLLTSASIFWFTRSFGTSMRFYAEYRDFVPVHDRTPVIEAPAAVQCYLGDVSLVPRRYAERHLDLRRWTVVEQGGHFGPAQSPAAFTDDVRDFFRPAPGR